RQSTTGGADGGSKGSQGEEVRACVWPVGRLSAMPAGGPVAGGVTAGLGERVSFRGARRGAVAAPAGRGGGRSPRSEVGRCRRGGLRAAGEHRDRWRAPSRRWR